jgi:hypothetical protein
MATTLATLLRLGVGTVVIYRAVAVVAALSLPEMLFVFSVVCGVLSLCRRRFDFVAQVLCVHTPATPNLMLVSTQPLTLSWSSGRSGLSQALPTSLIDVSSQGPGDEPLRWATQVPNAADDATTVELGELPPDTTYRIRVWSVGSRDGLKIASNAIITRMPPAGQEPSSKIVESFTKEKDEGRRAAPSTGSPPDLALVLHATSFAKQRQTAEQELHLLSNALQEDEIGLQAELRGLKELRRQEESTRKSLLRGLREMEDSRKAAEQELQRKQKECGDMGDVVSSTAATADSWSAELKTIQEGASLTAESVSQLASHRRTRLAEHLAEKATEANELRDVVNGLREQVLGIEAAIKANWDCIANLAVTSPPEPYGQTAEWQEELLLLQGETTRRQGEAATIESLLVEESRQKMALLQELASATR